MHTYIFIIDSFCFVFCFFGGGGDQFDSPKHIGILNKIILFLM